MKATIRGMALVLLLVVAVVAGCREASDDTVLSAKGESCTKTADCESGLMCVNLTCVDEIPSSDTYTPEKDISVNPKGTWTDPTSGLTWQVEPTGGQMEWSDAKAYCSGLSLGGGGWHLPTIEELRTLIRGCPGTVTGGSCGVADGCLSFSCWDEEDCWDCSSNNGPADGCYWPDEMQGTCSWYWSTTAVADIDDGAWYVTFGYGSVHAGYDYADWRVRCVR